ncbi:hypothetical protein M3Y96_00542200 [Aphelenchoides besseyi]|nr:hypothetical protein M3Y96_00542200 [Aphelenchoides besseyi]
MDVNENHTVHADVEFLRRILQYNYYPAFITGIIVNSSLIYLIVRRSPVSLRPYCSALLTGATIDGVFILIIGLSQIDFCMINGVSLVVFKGLARYFPKSVQWIIYACLSLGLTLEVFFLLLQNYYRYKFLQTRILLPPEKLFRLLLVIVGLSFIQLAIALFDYSYFEADRFVYQQLWPQDDSVTIIIVEDYKSDLIIILLGTYRSFVSLIAYLLAIVIGGMSIRVMRKEALHLSKKTKEMLRQFTNTLFMRMYLYGFTIVVPWVIQISIFYSNKSTMFSYIFMILFLWFPTVNSIFTFLLIGAYRKVLVNGFRSSMKFLHLRSSPQSISTVQRIT